MNCFLQLEFGLPVLLEALCEDQAVSFFVEEATLEYFDLGRLCVSVNVFMFFRIFVCSHAAIDQDCRL